MTMEGIEMTIDVKEIEGMTGDATTATENKTETAEIPGTTEIVKETDAVSKSSQRNNKPLLKIRNPLRALNPHPVCL